MRRNTTIFLILFLILFSTLCDNPNFREIKGELQLIAPEDKYSTYFSEIELQWKTLEYAIRYKLYIIDFWNRISII